MNRICDAASHICFNADLYCCSASDSRVHAVSIRVWLTRCDTAQTDKSVLPHTLINSNGRLYFCLKDEKKGKKYPQTPQYVQSHWKVSSFYVMVTCPNKSAISLPVLKGENFAFLRRFSGFYFCFSIVFIFCHFPLIIVQILSFEQKLLLGIEYPFKTPKNNS